MIIKVMTRKEPTFRQLLAYVSRDARDGRYVLTHNLLGADLDGFATEFETNARLLRQHHNGTILFHDILSITRSKALGLERQKEILKEIVQGYIARRAPGHLIYAGLHEDQPKHLHYHLVISANPHGDWRRAHLSKPELRLLQTEMEAHVLRQYPELEQKAVMGRKAKGDALTQPGQELKRRTGKAPERQRVVNALTAAFRAAHSKDELFRRLTDARLELYRRGKTIGVRDLDTSRNHRLATLGLAEAFKVMSQRIETSERARHVQHHAASVLAVPQASPTAQVAPTAALKTLSPAATPVHQPVPHQTKPQASPPPSLSNQEQSVNIFELAINGIGAIADALTVGPRTVKPVEEQVNDVRTRVAKLTKRHQKQKPSVQTTAAQAPPLIPVPTHTKNVRHAVNNSIDPDLTPDQVRVLNDVRQTMPPEQVHVLNEVRHAMAEERLKEIAEARQQQDQNADQRGSSLKR